MLTAVNIDELREVAETRKAISDLPDEITVDQNQASAILRALGRPLAPLTLRKLRCVSTSGPRFKKTPEGRVLYALGDLREFASATA